MIRSLLFEACSPLSLNVAGNFRYRRRDLPQRTTVPCGEAEYYRPRFDCQRLSPFFSAATIAANGDGKTPRRLLVHRFRGGRLSRVLLESQRAVNVLQNRRSSGTATDVNRGFEPSDDRRIMWCNPPCVKLCALPFSNRAKIRNPLLVAQ